MSIERLSPRKLNKDTDERSLKPDEARDALNISVGLDSNGNAGVVKPADGNVPSALSDELASLNGVNTVIGSVSDEETGVVYFFCYNSLQKHSVWAYSSKTDTYRLIFAHSSLNFDPDGFVKGDIIRVKKRPEAVPLEVSTGQGGPGGAVDFEEEQVIEFESEAIVVNLSFFIRRDLTVFTENANGIIGRESFLNVFNGEDFRIRLTGTDNNGNDLLLYSSEENASGNTLGEVQKDVFSTVGLSGNNGRALWQFNDVWVDASKFSGDAEIKIQIDFLGEYECHPWPSKITANIDQRLAIETINLSPSDFTSGNFSSSGADGNSDPSLGAPGKTLTTLTLSDVFANNLLNGVHTNEESSAYHVLRAQKRLVQFDVDSNGDVVSSGNSDAALRDRSVRVKTKLSLPPGLKSYAGSVVSLSEQYGENGGGGEIWGSEQGPPLSSRLDDGGAGGGADISTDIDPGSTPNTGNVYGLAWDGIMGAFRLVYFEDAFVQTITTNNLNPNYLGQRPWGDVYSEAIAAADENVQYAANGIQTSNSNPYKQVIPNSTAFSGFTIKSSGEFTDGSFVSNSGYVEVENGQFRAINDGLNLIQTVTNHFTNEVDTDATSIYDVNGKSRVIIVTLPETHASTNRSVFTELDVSAWGDTTKRKVFYVDHVGYASNLAFSQYRGNRSSLALEMRPDVVDGLQGGGLFLDNTFGIAYLNYLEGLDCLTYNIGVPLSYAMSEEVDFRRHMIHNWYWPGIRMKPPSGSGAQTAFINNNVESNGPLTTFPSTAQARAFERVGSFDGSSLLINSDVETWADINEDSLGINTLSNTPSTWWGNASVMLSNGQEWNGWTRVLSIPVVRDADVEFVEQGFFTENPSQISILAPDENTENGFIQYGPVNAQGDLLAFEFGLNSTYDTGGAPGPDVTVGVVDPTVVADDGRDDREIADDATDEGGGTPDGPDADGPSGPVSPGPTTPPRDSDLSSFTPTKQSISSKQAKGTIKKKY